MTNVLTITNLNKKYHQQQALKNINLSIPKGEILGLIGRNGAGKTTLLKSITQLINITSGSISLFDSTTNKEWTKNLKRTGSVIETPVAHDNLTAEQNLAYYCKLRGIKNQEAIIKETLQFVDLEKTAHKKFKQFSLGMKQKLGIAIAILSRPDFLILDEPINGLDPIAIIDFRKMILRLNEEMGMPIIISSHILSELYHVATSIAILDKGELIKQFTKTEFEQMNRDYIVLETSDTAKAALLLTEEFQFKLKVIDEQTLHIYGTSTLIREISVLLVNHLIPIDGIHFKKSDLENYYTHLLFEQQEEQSSC